MKLKTIFLITISIILANSAFAQNTELPTAKTIIENYVKAVGGKEAVMKQTSRYVKNAIEVTSRGIKGTEEKWSVAPNKSYSKFIFDGFGESIQAYDGKIAWSASKVDGSSREKNGNEFLQVQLANDFYREIKLDKLYPKMEVKGVEKVGDKDTYVVVATPKDLPAETFYFDQKTGLLLKYEINEFINNNEVKHQYFYEGYRAVDGVQVAFKVKIKTPSLEGITTITEIKHGVKVEDKLFTKPN